MRVTIATLHSQYIHASLSPWCLLAGMEAYATAPIEPLVVEATINEPLAAVSERLIATQAELFALSCYIWNITQTLQLATALKAALPDCNIVLGGPEVSYHAEQVLLENPAVDFVLSGEGELPIAKLCDALATGQPTQGLPGLCDRDAKGIPRIAPPYLSQDDPPSPYSPAFFAALQGRIAYLETSRGCPFSCAFCLSGRCGGVRFFDLERAKQDMLRLAQSGTQTIKFVDRTFNANRARARSIIAFLIEHAGREIPEGVCFHFEIAGDLLEEETFLLLEQVPPGLIQLEIGLQSFHHETLAAVRRTTDMPRLVKNIQRLLSFGNMHIHIDLIAGLPEEDFATFRQSFETAYALRPQMLQLGFLKLLHGAPMREEPEVFPCHFSPMPPYEVSQTPWLSSEELLRLHHLEGALDRLYNSGRFSETLAFLEKKYGSAFPIFDGFGDYCHQIGLECCSLDRYTEVFYRYCTEICGVDPISLRDCLVIDRLSTNSAGQLPVFLKRKDSRCKLLRQRLNDDPATRQPPKIKRSVEILYGKSLGIYVDYQNKHPVTGKFPYFLVSLPEN